MSVDKIFIKSFLNNFEDESFTVKLWDDEEIKVGQDESLFKVILNKPISKKELRETWVLSLGQEDPLEKEMATHSSILVWKVLWTEEESGGLQSMGS